MPSLFEKEIERRDKQKQKRKDKIVEEREKIRAIETESTNAERMQAEMARQIEELQRQKERAENYRSEEIKRGKQKLKRLESSSAMLWAGAGWSTLGLFPT